MKKTILLLLLVPFLGIGQDYPAFQLDQTEPSNIVAALFYKLLCACMHI